MLNLTFICSSFIPFYHKYSFHSCFNKQSVLVHVEVIYEYLTIFHDLYVTYSITLTMRKKMSHALVRQITNYNRRKFKQTFFKNDICMKMLCFINKFKIKIFTFYVFQIFQRICSEKFLLCEKFI